MEKLINEIKNGNYWRINLLPIDDSFNKQKINSINECYKIICDNSVLIHGRCFPHIDRDYGNFPVEDYEIGIDFVEVSLDVDYYREIWRYYQSSQFIFYIAIEDDYRIDEIKKQGNLPFHLNPNNDSGKYFNIERCIYYVCELFEFIKRLAENGKLESSFEISLLFKGMEDRILFLWERGRDFVPVLKCSVKKIPYNKIYNTNDFIVNANQYALEYIIFIMDLFKFKAVYLFKEIQEKFYSKIII